MSSIFESITACRSRFVCWLKSKVTVPLIHWTVSWWLVITFFAVLAISGVAGIASTNRSVFCSSCHEMAVHYSTWKVSSHKNVECEECHITPGMVNMVKAKFSAMRQVYRHVTDDVKPSEIKGHVPDENCKKCHASTRDTVVYHGLKITHKKHWNMGIGCTKCHDRVVHGPNAATINAPRMGTCFECHNGKKVSNNCTLCHETLGVRQPSAFSKEWVEGHKEEVTAGKQTCKRCHQPDFCNNCHRMATPHPADWVQAHPSHVKTAKQDCKLCHSESFCSDCHNLKRAHRADWVQKHPAEFRRQPGTCDQCHERNFCSDCHAQYQIHPKNWVRQHPSSVKQGMAKCNTCHTENFCVSCHQQKVPTSHENASWLRTHSFQASDENSTCKMCHKPDFCMKCHSKQKPKSHRTNWLKFHPAQATMNDHACKTCHETNFCGKCHGMTMPHPKKWDSQHRAAAKKDRKLCQRCHEENFCASCHRGTRPATHSSPKWVTGHGKAAAQESTCRECHTRVFCQSCHAGMLPPSHGNGWRQTHGKSADKKNGNCATCHGGKFCKDCHGVEMPHPQDWVMEHNGAKEASLADGSVCYRCNEKSYCQMCHTSQ
ncbi:MAG: NapC/NirT family cytochrome c [Armatimonadota bacterium]